MNIKALMAKPGWQVIKEWVAKRITELLGGLEEEVLIGFAFNLLEADEVSIDGRVCARGGEAREGWLGLPSTCRG